MDNIYPSTDSNLLSTESYNYAPLIGHDFHFVWFTASHERSPFRSLIEGIGDGLRLSWSLCGVTLSENLVIGIGFTWTQFDSEYDWRNGTWTPFEWSLCGITLSENFNFFYIISLMGIICLINGSTFNGQNFPNRELCRWTDIFLPLTGLESVKWIQFSLCGIPKNLIFARRNCVYICGIFLPWYEPICCAFWRKMEKATATFKVFCTKLPSSSQRWELVRKIAFSVEIKIVTI